MPSGQEVTKEITFTRWELDSMQDMVDCWTGVVALGAPFEATLYGRWSSDPESGEPVQVLMLQVGDGVGRGQETRLGNIVVRQGPTLMVLTPDEAVERGYA